MGLGYRKVTTSSTQKEEGFLLHVGLVRPSSGKKYFEHPHPKAVIAQEV